MKHFSVSYAIALGALALAAMLGVGCSSSANNSSSSTTSSTTSTTTTLSSSSSSTTPGTSITLTATVSPTAATGTVTFYSGSTSLGTGTLSSGTATLTTSFSNAGSYSITAVYGGSSTYATSTSSAISITVASPSLTATTTSLTSSSTSPTTGTSITLTAAVSPTAATGTVTFYNGTTSLGTGTLSSGTATLTTSFSSAGTYSITAVYGGSSTYATSTSSSVSIAATSASSTGGSTATATTLATASATAYPGSLVALTATVTASGSAVPSTSGTVTFSYSGTALTCTNTTNTYASVSSLGTAICTTHFNSTGTYDITATFNGDSTYSSSTSSSVSEEVATGTDSLELSNTCPSTGTTTAEGVSVTYCLYSGVVYAANPVSSTYETMNIYVPTKIGSTSVSGMPIMFENGVGGYMSSQAGQPGTNGTYALSKGYVVVEPGCRGRDNGSSGDYFGVAPAAMVDLKAAIRFLRYNYSLGTFTGDVSHIISSGGSAGGALSALLGASGNSSLYYSYLAAIGAADANDNIFALGAWSPITNLDHADMSYEMEYGTLSDGSSEVNQTVSAALISEFDTYQNGLALTDKRGSLGALTSSNITSYILTEYMEPSLEKYVAAGSSAPSYATCAASSSSTYGYTCTFTFANYVSNSIGTRGKGVPAFDSFFDITSSNTYYGTEVNTACQPEAMEFGNPTGTTTYSGSNCSGGSPRHFTNFSSEAIDSTAIPSSMQTIVNMMNPMYYIMNAISSGDSSGVAKYWYIRDGTIATDTSAYVIVDLATSLDNLLGTSYVNAWEDWGEGHNIETDPGGFSSWVSSSVAAN